MSLDKRSSDAQFFVGQARLAIEKYVGGLRECANNLRSVHDRLVEKRAEQRGKITKSALKKHRQCVVSMRDGSLQCPRAATFRWKLGAVGVGKCAAYCQYHHALLQQSLIRSLEMYEREIQRAIRNAEQLLRRMDTAGTKARARGDNVFNVAMKQIAALSRKLYNAFDNAGRELQRIQQRIDVDALQYFLGRLGRESALNNDIDRIVKERGGLSASGAVLIKSACFGFRVAKAIGQLDVTARDLLKKFPNNRGAQRFAEQATRSAQKLQQRTGAAERVLCKRLKKAGGYDVCRLPVCIDVLEDECDSRAR